MKDLRAKLAERGITTSERAIRYYIAEGLLEKPEYPHQNQATYNDKHLRDLTLIYQYQKQGYKLEQIREFLKTGFDGEDFDLTNDTLLLKEKVERDLEWSLLTRQEEIKLYSFSDLQSIVREDVLQLALKLDIMPIKKKYDGIELHMLKCMENYLKYQETPRLTDYRAAPRHPMAEMTSRLERMKSLAEQIASETVSSGPPWLNTSLLNALVVNRARKEVVRRSQELASWADGPVFIPATCLPDSPRFPYWWEYYKALHGAEMSMPEFLLSKEDPAQHSFLDDGEAFTHDTRTIDLISEKIDDDNLPFRPKITLDVNLRQSVQDLIDSAGDPEQQDWPKLRGHQFRREDVEETQEG